MPGGSDLARCAVIHNNTTAARRNLKASGTSALQNTEGFVETLSRFHISLKQGVRNKEAGGYLFIHI